MNFLMKLISLIRSERTYGHALLGAMRITGGRGAFMFSLICVWRNDWVNDGEAGDLRRYRAHYDVTVMKPNDTRPFHKPMLTPPLLHNSAHF